MFVVGAFASASASALTHTFLTCLNVGAGKGQWEDSACSKAKTGGGWETSEVANGTKVEGTSGVSKLKSELLGAEILITCTKDVFKGELETKGASKGEVTFEGCSASSGGAELANCEVPNIKFKFLDQLVLEEVKAGEFEVADEFKPAVAGPFVEIEIKNKGTKSCLQKGTFPVTGTQKCLLPEASIFKVLHKIDCKPVGSILEFNKKPATFESLEEVELSAPKAGVLWAVL